MKKNFTCASRAAHANMPGTRRSGGTARGTAGRLSPGRAVMRTNRNGHNGYEPPDGSPKWSRDFVHWADRSFAFTNGGQHRSAQGAGRNGSRAVPTLHTGPLEASASGRFQLLHRSADCCRWHISQDLSVAGQSYHGYGTMLGGLTAQDRKEGAVSTGPKLSQVSTPAGCEKPCLSAYRCTFFSHSASLQHCIFCSACDLKSSRPGAAYTSWARSSNAVPRDSPFPWAASLGLGAAVGAAARFLEVRATADELLGPILQGNYSRAVYGAENRVPLRELRLIWLQLLPKPSLKLLSMVGMCKWEAKPPLQPFYFVQDMQSNPVDAMWLSRGPSWEPLASHTWVEVTHCPNRRATVERRKREIMPLMRWKHRPMWFYVAPGSGVSLNLGKTVAVRSYEAAVWLLRRIFPGQVPKNATCESINSVERRLADPDLAADLKLEDAHGQTPIYRTEDVVRGNLDIASIDTIQILSHREYFSRESKVEVVVLRWAECADLPVSSSLLRCGRAPHFSCDDRATSFARLSTCAKFNGKLLRGRTGRNMRQLSRFGRSPCSSSPCYSVDGRWFCPASKM